MKSKQQAGIVFLGVFFVYGASWALMPSVSLLHDADSRVERQASVHLERARRLLQRYSFSLLRAAGQLERLADVGVDAGESDDFPVDEYQRIHGRLWEDFHPTDWAKVSRAARANYGNIPGQVREGAAACDDLVAQNDRFLDEALRAVGEALSVSHGDASSRAHAEATRLKGLIIYQQGLAEQLRARQVRRLAIPLRTQLARVAGEASGYRAALDRVSYSGIDEQIAALRSARADEEDRIRATTARLEEVDLAIGRLEAELEQAQRRSDVAERAMGRLQDAGVDLTDPNGAALFETEFLQHNREFRLAQRDIQALNVGGLPHAHIDRSDDFLTGFYIENGSSKNLTVRPGLRHYRDHRKVISGELDLQRRSLDDADKDVARLAGMKTAIESVEHRAAAAMKELTPRAEEVFTELNRVESEGFALEETALELFEQAARVSEQATAYSRDWIRGASRKAQLASTEARSRSAFDPPSKSNWIAGYVAAQVADARTARAWVFYERYVAHREDADLLARFAEGLGLHEADIEAEQTKSQEAQAAAIEEVKAAMSSLEAAHRDADRHWTLVAQAAGTVYLLALLGDESYAHDSLETYRQAIQGREDESVAAVYAQRIRQLENR